MHSTVHLGPDRNELHMRSVAVRFTAVYFVYIANFHVHPPHLHYIHHHTNGGFTEKTNIIPLTNYVSLHQSLGLRLAL